MSAIKTGSGRKRRPKGPRATPGHSGEAPQTGKPPSFTDFAGAADLLPPPGEMKIVAQKRDADGPAIDRALEIVRKFIIERKLVLYGGLAIDYALRLKGESIYSEDERPDFDVLSPRNVDDAYDLAEILDKAGFENVGAIVAIHTQTMRVRTDFVPVADVSFVPPRIYASLPTVEYKGIRVVHPDFQRMDMHLAFCFPFRNPPQEDVFHRWKKDLKRFNLLSKAYPITPCNNDSPVWVRQRVELPIAADRFAFGGVAALALLRKALAALLETKGADMADLQQRLARVPDPKIEIGVKVEFDSPKTALFPDGLPLTVATPDEVKGAVWSRSFLEKRPEQAKIKCDGGLVHVLSTANEKLAVSIVDKRAVATPQFLLLNFLADAHLADGSDRDVAVRLYLWTLEVINLGAAALARLPGGGAGAAASSPFGLPTKVLGEVNHSNAFQITTARASENVGDTPPLWFGVDGATVQRLTKGVPKNYYPGRHGGATRPKFEYQNPLFQLDGQVHDGNDKKE